VNEDISTSLASGFLIFIGWYDINFLPNTIGFFYEPVSCIAAWCQGLCPVGIPKGFDYWACTLRQLMAQV